MEVGGGGMRWGEEVVGGGHARQVATTERQLESSDLLRVHGGVVWVTST